MHLSPATNRRNTPGEATLQAAAAGDESASVGDIRDRLMGFAVKLVWNREDAEEIVQEAFRLGLKKMIAIQDAQSMPWLMRTVANLGLNLRRRIRPQPLLEHMEIAAESVPDALENAQRIEGVRRRILELPAQQRLAITLRMLEGREYPQIAEIMEISISAARTHVHLARQTLMRDLKEDER